MFICLVGPATGTILSAVVGNKIGGWQSRRALLILCIMCAISISTSLPAPFSDNFYIVVFFFNGLLTVGAFILPGTYQQILCSVEADDRPIANSIAQVCFNLFGYLPSPTLYGTLQSISGSEDSRWGMIMLMIIPIPSTFMFILAYMAYDNKEEQKDDKKEKLLEEQNSKEEEVDDSNEQFMIVRDPSLRELKSQNRRITVQSNINVNTSIVPHTP